MLSLGAKLSIALSLLCGSMVSLYAQGNLLLGQYQEFLAYYNPAAIGLSDELRIAVLHNRQNEGLEGAAKSFVLMGDMQLSFLGRNHGVGLQMSNEKIGLFTDTELALRYTYLTNIWEGKLNIGMQMMLHNSSFSGDEVYIPTGIDGMQIDDPSIPKTKVVGKAMDMQIGLYYRHKRWNIGASISHLLSPSVLLDQKYKVDLPRAYNLFAAYQLLQTERAVWTPSVFVSMRENGFYRWDSNIELRYAHRFRLHALYRWRTAWGVGAGLDLRSLYLGYHFEMPTSALRHNNWGTHELMFSYRLPIERTNKNAIYKSVRLL